jgi:hypothetical protein
MQANVVQSAAVSMLTMTSATPSFMNAPATKRASAVIQNICPFQMDKEKPARSFLRAGVMSASRDAVGPTSSQAGRCAFFCTGTIDRKGSSATR